MHFKSDVLLELLFLLSLHWSPCLLSSSNSALVCSSFSPYHFIRIFYHTGNTLLACTEPPSRTYHRNLLCWPITLFLCPPKLENILQIRLRPGVEGRKLPKLAEFWYDCSTSGCSSLHREACNGLRRGNSMSVQRISRVIFSTLTLWLKNAGNPWNHTSTGDLSQPDLSVVLGSAASSPLTEFLKGQMGPHIFPWPQASLLTF